MVKKQELTLRQGEHGGISIAGVDALTSIGEVRARGLRMVPRVRDFRRHAARKPAHLRQFPLYGLATPPHIGRITRAFPLPC
jgi:hypothetical protein